MPTQGATQYLGWDWRPAVAGAPEQVMVVQEVAHCRVQSLGTQDWERVSEECKSVSFALVSIVVYWLLRGSSDV